MKRFTLLAFMLLVQLSIFAQVIAYEHPNFQGRYHRFFEGRYPDFGHTQLGHDRLSSMKIPEGYIVYVYEHPNFQGQEWVFTRTFADMPKHMHDKASSMIVKKNDGTVVTDNNQYDTRIYTSCDYRGSYETLRPGNYSTIPSRVRGRVASIRVPYNYTVIFYSKTGYRGQEYVVTDSRSCLPSDVQRNAASMRLSLIHI